MNLNSRWGACRVAMSLFRTRVQQSCVSSRANRVVVKRMKSLGLKRFVQEGTRLRLRSLILDSTAVVVSKHLGFRRFRGNVKREEGKRYLLGLKAYQLKQTRCGLQKWREVYEIKQRDIAALACSSSHMTAPWMALWRVVHTQRSLLLRVTLNALEARRREKESLYLGQFMQLHAKFQKWQSLVLENREEELCQVTTAHPVTQC